MTIRVLDKKAPDMLLVPLLQNDALAAHLSELAARAGVDAAALQNDFKAEAKEVFVLYSSTIPARKMYLLGLGKKTGYADLQVAFRSFCHRYKSKLPLRPGIDLRHVPAADIPRLAEAAVCGTMLGLYNPGLYRTDAPAKTADLFGADKSELLVMSPTEQLEAVRAAAHRGQVFAEVTRKILDFVNTPGNKKTPEILAGWALEAGQADGFKVSVMHVDEMRKKGLDALYSVGKGSPHPPVLILLEYGIRTRKVKTPSIGLVGKGVTFDTGGVSIKPSASMQYMKSDMGGAAAVLGAFMVAARLQLPVRMVGAIPAAENMIDGLAIKPGDVIGSFAGKTIEVTDTDAEGRLILADALAYLLEQEKVDVLLDLATLTGSVIRALGNQCAGVFTQNDDLSAALQRAGEQSGERLWRLPLWDEYGSDLKSDVADLRNFTGKPVAECISAAKFLEHFTAAHPAWAHLDIAGVSFGDSEFAQSKTATGYGIRLLVEFMEKWGGEG